MTLPEIALESAYPERRTMKAKAESPRPMPSTAATRELLSTGYRRGSHCPMTGRGVGDPGTEADVFRGGRRKR